MEARPTEYCGIKFKSKSEARIAHLFTSLGIAWMYEPQWLRLPCGYVPDFYTMKVVADEVAHPHPQHNGNMLIYHHVYEFKPKRPTNTYIDELGERFAVIAGILESARIPLDAPVECSLIVGGMGYGKAEVMHWEHCGPSSGGWHPMWFKSWHLDKDEEALLDSQKGYRFDLDHSEAR